MTELNVVVKDKLGIHARPAAVIAKTAATFKSKITLELNGKTALQRRESSLTTVHDSLRAKSIRG